MVACDVGQGDGLVLDAGGGSAVVVDAGYAAGGEASTIVDATGNQGRILRRGSLSVDVLNEALASRGVVLTDED